ncbi:MAG: permease [bacterium]
MEKAAAVFLEFLKLTLEVLPYFLIGAAFGALLETYPWPGNVLKKAVKGPFSVCLAALAGIILPGCACATMPMAESMKRRGAALGTIVAFIMSAPILSPQTAVLTWAVLGPEFTVARIFFALSGSIAAGMLFTRLENTADRFFITPPAPSEKHYPDGCYTEEEENAGFLANFWSVSKSLGKYFMIGMLISAVLTVLLPENAISRYIGGSGPAAYLLSLITGMPMYVCEGEEIPITLALMKNGLGRGPALTFLLGSVGTCIPTIAMARKIIGTKATFLYVAFWCLFALLSGLVFNLF